VFAEAARLDKAVEVDCYPDRQDLNVELLKVARNHGPRISIGTDAHHSWQLEFVDLGLAAALSAKILADRILNFMPALQLKAWAQTLRDCRMPRRKEVKEAEQEDSRGRFRPESSECGPSLPKELVFQ